jgi:RNA polymerase sigma-70 factor (ECF subfamily)
MPSDLRDASDAALVLAIARYRNDALAEAYRRHAGPVFGLARRLLNDQARAEEVVQEVFLRLWSAPDRYDPERGSLRSFLLAHCHGRSVDLIRADAARRRREEAEFVRPDPMPDIMQEVWDVALSGFVREALSELPEGERVAIEQAYFGGRTYREVAEMLGEPEGTVKSRIRSGLRRLREQLQAAGVTPGVV